MCSRVTASNVLKPDGVTVKIAKVELFRISIPLRNGQRGLFPQRRAFHPNWIPGFHQQDVKLYLLRLTTDSGLDGVAAVPAMGTERDSLGSLLGSYLIGLNPLDIRLVNQRIQEFNYIGMRNGWVDAAFWDIIGKERRQPLWQMLGGTGGVAQLYASLGSNHEHDPTRVAALVRQRREEGFAGVKIRVKSLDLERMVEVVAAARDAAGPHLSLMVDANLGWPVELLEPSPRWSEEFAAEFAQRIESYGVAWLEEPLHRGAFAALARLRGRTKTPIAGGEINSSWDDFRRMLELGSLDVYQPDAVLAGGTFAGGISVVYWLIQEIKRRNAAAEPGQRVRYTPHTWTNGIGFSVNLQLFGSQPADRRGLLELPYDELWEPKHWACFLRGGLSRAEPSQLRIPDAPGLGIELDWDVIERFGKRVYLGTQASVAARTVREYGLREALYLRKARRSLAPQAFAFELPEPPLG